ncbi:MAG: hypothetical protein KDB53_02810, partial [Planctomycetes bacterium]|nr:hypothetical protein [Planctomycetota bacterium]
MRVALIGRHSEDIRSLAVDAGLVVVRPEDTPEVMIAYGGDGTLIGAEAAWPGVPKLGMRSSRSCAKCDLHGDEAVLARLAAGEAERTELIKLVTQVGPERFYGVNDILLRNSDIR